MTDHTSLSPDEARAAVRDAIGKVVPEADLDTLGDSESFRSELELDSLDFLSFVERLSTATGVRIDEVDYPDLVSMATSIAFLTRSHA